MIGQAFRRLWNDKRGNVLILFGLSLPPLLGMIGLAVEGSQWYTTKGDLQNAADQAVVAAATNASAGYANEAKAIAALHGLTNGVGLVTVAASNAATCPTGGTTCYSVTVTKTLPLIFSKIIGYTGNTSVNSKRAFLVSATAIATRQLAPREYCITALGTSGDALAFLVNGGPKADLSGCNVMSNSSMDCNGHDLNAENGDAFGTSEGCGLTQNPNMPKVIDPYAARAAKIPANTCSAYPQAPSNKNDPALPADNVLSGAKTYATQTFCGDVKLSGDVVLSGTSNVIVIRNGNLDLNGYRISTATGAAATIVFSGTTGAYGHIPTGGGAIDIAAPTSGDWSGVALYQDPNLTTGVNVSDAGNSPSWNITGLVYLPRSDVLFSGVVGKATTGKACFILVVDTIRINGTGSILSRGECAEAGLTPPSNPVPVRGKLVA